MSDLAKDFRQSSNPKKLHDNKSKKKKKKQGTNKGRPTVDVLETEKKNVEKSLKYKEEMMWREFIRKHRTDLKKARPVVDDSPPKLIVSNIYNVDMLKGTRADLKAPFDSNLNMVKSLYEVSLVSGRTNTFNFDYNKETASNYSTRRTEAKAIEEQNRLISETIKNSRTRMITVKEYAEEWKRLESIMENASEFPLFWKVKKKKQPTLEVASPPPQFKQYVTEKSAKFPDKRPRVYFDIAIRNVGVVGKMVAVLFSDYVPMTVKNFLAFCDPKAPLTYKGNLFYLIFQEYYCQTGDVVENRGYGGTSIYGPYFGNEDLTLKHGERGVLTMYNQTPNRNHSQFLITFKKLESLDGQNVVFGKIIKGFHVLDAIESVGSKKTGRPKVEIYISDCDEI